ncbi:hypothetical protein Mapa_013548 [Marchantia paleacea]|nr:hypothetical protein Mapa_013548 [Marchantia paleacea]
MIASRSPPAAGSASEVVEVVSSFLCRSIFMGAPFAERRTRSWREARAFALCTEPSHVSHRYASSAAQYHRARSLPHTSQGRAARPAMAIAAAIPPIALLFMAA